MKLETEKKYRTLTADESKWLVGTLDTLISEDGSIGKVSDGYHTFDELYHHRTLLFASVCNLQPDLAWKSRQHDDHDFPMYDGMFIAGIATKNGQATYHCDDEYWDMFHVKELERAPVFDGHTSDQAVERIYTECSKTEMPKPAPKPDNGYAVPNAQCVPDDEDLDLDD